MIFIKNKLIPFSHYNAITILGLFCFYKKELSDKTKNHERIHSRQVLEMGIIGFYLWYCIEYLIVRFYHKKQVDGYHDISFEEECYLHEYDFNYLATRKPYAWIKYIKIRSWQS